MGFARTDLSTPVCCFVESRCSMGGLFALCGVAIGNNPSYLNRIINGRSLPRWKDFFLICSALGIKPKDFFDETLSEPQLINEICDELNGLSHETLQHALAFLKSIKEGGKR